MSSQESFPERLRAYRRSMGWTQEQLAKRWSYSFAAISAWERGKRFPSGQEIPQLALRLEMEPEELVKCINATRNKTNQPEILEVGNRTGQEKRNASTTEKELEGIYLNRTEFTSGFSYPRMFENAHTILAVGISLNAIAMSYSTEKIIRSIVEAKSTYSLCFLDPDGVKCGEREDEENLPPGTLAKLTRLN